MTPSTVVFHYPHSFQSREQQYWEGRYNYLFNEKCLHTEDDLSKTSTIYSAICPVMLITVIMSPCNKALNPDLNKLKNVCYDCTTILHHVGVILFSFSALLKVVTPLSLPFHHWITYKQVNVSRFNLGPACL